MADLRRTLRQFQSEAPPSGKPARKTAETEKAAHRRASVRAPGRRTPAAALEAPPGLAELPADAPDWMLKSRMLSSALEGTIAQANPGPRLKACIERAWAAWELNGLTDKQIAKVSNLVMRAHRAIRETARSQLNRAIIDCAEILHAGLPSPLKRRTRFELVLDVVRAVRDEADADAAMIAGTMRLCGWSELMREAAAEAIRIALEEYPPVSSVSNR